MSDHQKAIEAARLAHIEEFGTLEDAISAYLSSILQGDEKELVERLEDAEARLAVEDSVACDAHARAVAEAIAKITALRAELEAAGASVPEDVSGLVEEWRKAAEDVTPGPWMSETEHSENVEDDDRQQEVYVCSKDTVCDYTVLSTMGRTESVPLERKQANAAWIARCSPTGIGTLLDALATMAAELEAVKRERGALDHECQQSMAEIARGRARAETAEASLATLREQVAEKDRALEPFAKRADAYDLAYPPYADDDWTTVLIGDLRAARRARAMGGE